MSFSYTSRAGFVFCFCFCFVLFFLFLFLGSFSYTSYVGFTFLWGVSRTHPLLTSFLCGEFLLHIPFCLHFYPVSISDTSRVGFVFCFVFILGVSLTHPVLVYFFYWGCFSYTSDAGFIFIGGVSLTYPVLASFLSGEFRLHIPCWLRFFFFF